MKFRKIIFNFSIGIITLWISLSIISVVFNIEITDSVFKRYFEIIKIFLVLSSVLFTMIWTIRRTKTILRNILNIIYTLIVFSIFTLIFGLGYFFNTMCKNYDSELYISKTNPNEKIVLRYYDCGALDGDISEPKMYKLRNFTYCLGYTKRIEEVDISIEDWEIIKK